MRILKALFWFLLANWLLILLCNFFHILNVHTHAHTHTHTAFFYHISLLPFKFSFKFGFVFIFRNNHRHLRDKIKDESIGLHLLFHHLRMRYLRTSSVSVSFKICVLCGWLTNQHQQRNWAMLRIDYTAYPICTWNMDIAT